MNEVVKTLIYVGTACFFGLLALLLRPSDAEFTLDDIERQVNTPLFPQFADPGESASLEIVRVNEAVGRLERFKVARDVETGQWTIPSHNGYPADADEQMRTASVAFIDLPIIGIASTVSEEHELFGVVQPDDRTADVADGVGLLVSIADAKGENLAQLIVGKSVRGSEGQRFVRKPGQDVVYVAAIDPDKFSTRFEDWIQRDLLQLNAFDVETVRIEDYTVGGVIRNNALVPDQQQRMEADLRLDSTGGTWTLERLVTFQNRQPIEQELSEDEELNVTKLNDLKEAIASMQIVDVFRKPAGLGANLRTDESFMRDAEALQSLVDKGFYPVRRPNSGDFELKAANGEIRVGTRDGVEYILRFGNTAGSQQDDPDKMNRFMFVTARFDESRFPMPEPPVLPTPPARPAATETEAAETEVPGQSEGDEEASEETCAAPQEEAADSSPEPDAPISSEAVEDEETASRRQQLEAEYQRKLDAREENIRKGREKARELNDRFADWYYVISEDYFKRIHLTRSDLVRPKGSDPGAGPGAGFPGDLNLPGDLQLPGLPSLPELPDEPAADLPEEPPTEPAAAEDSTADPPPARQDSAENAPEAPATPESSTAEPVTEPAEPESPEEKGPEEERSPGESDVHDSSEGTEDSSSEDRDVR